MIENRNVNIFIYPTNFDWLKTLICQIEFTLSIENPFIILERFSLLAIKTIKER